MKERFKEILLNKKVQYMLAVTFLVLLGSMVTYIATYTFTEESMAEAILVKTKYDFPILVKSEDQLEGKILIEDGIYNEHLSRVIRRIAKKGDICIDIGAGYGYHTILMSKLVEDDGKVYSYEAIPNIYNLLNYSIGMNYLHNVYKFNKLLYSQNTEAFLETYQKYSTLSSTFQSAKKAKEKEDNLIKLNATTLDSLLPNLSNVTLIKMDTNGSELAVIKGAKDIISRSPDLSIILPWNSTKFSNYGDIYPRLIDNFLNAKFEFWLINHDGSLKLVQKDQLLTLNGSDILITKHNIS